MSDRFELARHRIARVWIGECPGANYPTAGAEHFQLSGAGVNASLNRVSVELTVPKGPLIMYGLLGAIYQPSPDRDRLDVLVSFSGTPLGEGPTYASEIAPRSEQPVIGLPLEFVSAVIAGIREVVKDGSVGSGRLAVDCAAHGAVGSNPRIFRSLATLVVAIVTNAVQDHDETGRLLEQMAP
jgi:hypothetical protein